MASVWVWRILFSVLLICGSFHASVASQSTSTSDSNVKFPRMFDAIYQFGDGSSDTGNMHIMDSDHGSRCSSTPYGETLSSEPTGRCSDGFLMIDYFARAFDLPLLEPYLGTKSTNGTYFAHGVNFAVDGAFATNVFTNPTFRHTLSDQLEWFRNYLDFVCSSTSECKQKLEKSLFVVGGIGANDYQFNLDTEADTTMQDAHNLVPEVVHTIKNAVKEVIERGATNVVVPGLLPLGCLPLYQKQYGSAPEYDTLGCQTLQNELARTHNEQLQHALDQLRNEYPKTAILYGDYYKGFTWLLRNAVSLGFEKDSNFKQCCGWPTPCGVSDAPLCPDPNTRISWDGIHLTQQAYRNLAGRVLSDLFSRTASPSQHSGATMTSTVLLQAIVISIVSFWAIASRWI